MTANARMTPIAGCIAILVAACSNQTPSEMANITISGSVKSSLVTNVSAITSVAITIDGKAIQGSPFAVDASGAFGPVTATLAPGAHDVSATATDGVSQYSATSHVNAVVGQNPVTLYLFDTSAPQQFQSMPVLVSMTVTPGALTVTDPQSKPTATVTAVAFDFDKSVSSYSFDWSDGCGGTFTGATSINDPSDPVGTRVTATATYTPHDYNNVASAACTLGVKVTAHTPGGDVSDPKVSAGSVNVTVTYVATFTIAGSVVTPPFFTGATISTNLGLCDLGAPTVLALSASSAACETALRTGRDFTYSTTWSPPPNGVLITAQGTVQCAGYAPMSGAATINGSTASFIWPASVPADAPCELSMKVTFADPTGNSSPSSVDATLPVSFLLRQSPTAVLTVQPQSHYYGQYVCGQYVCGSHWCGLYMCNDYCPSYCNGLLGFTVTSSPAGISCTVQNGSGSVTGTCQATFPVGTGVTLQSSGAATTFTGGCSGVGSCAVTVTADATVSAAL